MNPILFQIGPIVIYWYSLMIFIALFVGGSLALKECKKWKIEEDTIIDMFFYLIPISIIGARLYFVLFHYSYYSKNLLDIIKIWEGGLAIHGGMIAGLAWIVYYTKKYKINTIRMLDIIVTSLIIGQAIGRWGNFMNQEAYGSVTTLGVLKGLHIPKFIINGMLIGGKYHHPTFLYESIWCIIGFVLLIVWRNRKYTKLGSTTALYLIWYGIGRFLIESLRTDSLMLGNFKMAQIVSIIMVVLGVVIFRLINKTSKFDNLYNNVKLQIRDNK